MSFSYFPTVTTNDLTLPLYIGSVGADMEEKRIVRPGGMKEAQLLCTSAGSGTAEVGGKSYSLTEGAVLFLRAFEPHAYYPRSPSWKTSWITYGGTAAEQLLRTEEHIIEPVRELDFNERLEEIYLSLDGGSGGLESSALLYRLLFEIGLSAGRRHTADTGENNSVRAVFDYIREHYAESIQLSELAEAAGVSREYLCQLFKEETGMRPFEYLTQYRIGAAKSLLKSRRDLKVSEVGRLAGFCDSSYFNKVFKRYEAVTPLQYSGKEQNV